MASSTEQQPVRRLVRPHLRGNEQQQPNTSTPTGGFGTCPLATAWSAQPGLVRTVFRSPRDAAIAAEEADQRGEALQPVTASKQVTPAASTGALGSEAPAAGGIFNSCDTFDFGANGHGYSRLTLEVGCECPAGDSATLPERPSWRNDPADWLPDLHPRPAAPPLFDGEPTDLRSPLSLGAWGLSDATDTSPDVRVQQLPAVFESAGVPRSLQWEAPCFVQEAMAVADITFDSTLDGQDPTDYDDS